MKKVNLKVRQQAVSSKELKDQEEKRARFPSSRESKKSASKAVKYFEKTESMPMIIKQVSGKLLTQ